MKLSIRKVYKKDSSFLFKLKNDPDTIINSLISKAVSRSEHDAWFDKKLKDQHSKIFIFENFSKERVGFIRFDFNKSKTYGTISIAIAKEFRGRKYSNKMINQGMKEISKTQPVVFFAEVKKSNESSLKAFKACGFGVEKIDKDIIKLSNKQTIIDAIENVRSRNNVNWMNLLRLAFKISPKEAGDIMGNINSDDSEISRLLKLLTTK